MSKSVKRNFVYNSIFQIVKIIVPIVSIPYLSRVLGPSNIGIYSYTYSITNYFVLFATLGMSTYGVRAIASAGDDRAQRSRLFYSIFASQVAVFAIVFVAYVVYSLTIAQGGRFLCALWGFWVLSTGVDVTWLMFGVEDFKPTAIRSISVTVAELVLILLLVKTEYDLWVYVAIMSIGYLASQVVMWPFVHRFVDYVKPTWAEVRVHFLPNLRLFIPVVAISLYTTMDKVLLGSLSTMRQTGFYEYSEKVAKVPLALITALGTVMLPRMSALFSSGDDDTAVGMIETSMWFMQLCAFAMMFGISAVSPEFAPVFLGGDFAGCAPTMTILSLVIPLIAGSNVIGKQYLLPTVQDGKFTLSVIIGAVVNIVLMVFLAPAFGANGGAISTVAAEATVLVAQLVMVRKSLPLRRFALNSAPFFAIGLTMMLLVRATANALRAAWGLNSTTLAVEIIVGAFAYTLLASTYCLLTRNRHFLRLIAGLRRRTTKRQLPEH